MWPKSKLLRPARAIRRHLTVRCPYEHSFSQEGEDRILARIFEGVPTGFYVDVGAHHPTRFSNTYLFYRQGWRGINVDASPGSMAAFRSQRPRDLNLEVAVSDNEEVLDFFIFNEPALNTFDRDLANERDGCGPYRIVATRAIPTTPLFQLLNDHMPANTMIDFLSVDVEGWDLPVLRSNDWDLYRPRYVLAEDFGVETIDEALIGPLAKYLYVVNYQLFAKTAHTLIFRSN